MVARQPGKKIHRHADWVGDGFVLQINHARQEVEKILLRKNPFLVNSSNVSREAAGVRQLTFATAIVFVISDRKCFYLFCQLTREKSAALVLESIPPDKKTPTGTSLTVRSATLVRNSDSRRSAISSSETPVSGVVWSRTSQ